MKAIIEAEKIAASVVSLRNLRCGDWISRLLGGLILTKYCVVQVPEDGGIEVIGLQAPEWSRYSVFFVSCQELFDEQSLGWEVKFLGHTKIRWWRKFLGPFKSRVFPYPKPKETR